MDTNKILKEDGIRLISEISASFYIKKQKFKREMLVTSQGT